MLKYQLLLVLKYPLTKNYIICSHLISPTNSPCVLFLKTKPSWASCRNHMVSCFLANIFVQFCLNSPKPKYEGHQSVSAPQYLLVFADKYWVTNSSIYKLKYSSVYDCCFVVIEIEWSVCSLALSWKRKVGNNIWNEELACNYLYREFTCSTRTAAGWPEPTAWRHCFDKKKNQLDVIFPQDNQLWCCNHSLKFWNLDSIRQWSG